MRSKERGVFSIIEWFVLVIVILASMTLNLEENFEEEPEMEISNISGTIILSTRSSMDALGLDDFDRGAIATINLNSSPIKSEGCVNCENNPKGLHISGNVNLTGLIDETDRVGRIEARLNIIYLHEILDNGMISKEWFSINWSAGDISEKWDLVIIHDPPKWEPEGRYDASFIDVNESKFSRTGPWIVIEKISENVENSHGCLPDSFTCESLTPHEINLTTTFKLATTPIIIQHPDEWSIIEGSPNTNNSPTGLDSIRDMVDISGEINETRSWCLTTEEDIIASKSWAVIDSNNPIISPMGIWFEALGLPSGSFSFTGGIWNEVDFGTLSCSSLSNNEGNLRFGVSQNNN